MIEATQSRAAKFLSYYDKPSTISFYRITIRKFFTSVYGEGDFHEQSDLYFSEARDYEQDLNEFYSSIKGMARSSISSHLSVIKQLFIENDIEVPSRVWRRLRKRSRNARASHLDKVPTTDELRRMLSHMSIQGQALCLMMSSAGTRIGETLQITLQDVDLKSRPGKVQLKAEYTKGNQARVVFFSRETTDAIDEWLKSRDQYLITKKIPLRALDITEPDNRLFPFTYSTVRAMWKTALRKSQLDEKMPGSHRFMVHPHVLRKYFRTKLGAVIPVDIVEALMGHANYLTDAYRRYSFEDLGKFYLQGEPALLVFADNTDLLQLRDEVDAQRRYYQALITENTDNSQRLQALESKFTKLVSFVEQFQYDADQSLSSPEWRDLDIEELVEKIDESEEE